MKIDSSFEWHQREWYSLTAILIGALTLRLIRLAPQGLWYDEISSVTYAVLPLRRMLLAVQELDPHPPLYYLQLHFWLRLGANDVWIKFNSVLWSMLTIGSLFVTGRKVYGRSVALLASLLFAIMPLSILYAQNARMYTMLMCLAVWTWYFSHQFLHNRPTWHRGFGIIVTTIVFLYSHGAGFLLLVSMYSYAIYFWLTQRDKGRRLWWWLLVQVIILLLYIPWLVEAQKIIVRHTLTPGLADVARTLFALLLGFGRFPDGLVWLVMLVAVAVFLGLYVFVPPGRDLILAFIIIPSLFLISVSYYYRPIWHVRVLTYTLPFLSLMLALGIAHLLSQCKTQRIWLRFGLALVVVSLFIAAFMIQSRTFSYLANYREAAAYMESAMTPGDGAYIPNRRVYWGWSWYLQGPGSVDPLNDEKTLVLAKDNHVIWGGGNEDVFVPGESYWLMYPIFPSGNRSLLGPFENRITESSRNFNDLIIERAQLAEGSGE